MEFIRRRGSWSLALARHVLMLLPLNRRTNRGVRRPESVWEHGTQGFWSYNAVDLTVMLSLKLLDGFFRLWTEFTVDLNIVALRTELLLYEAHRLP